MRSKPVTLFTIASKNYLAYVRVLLKSVAAVHPEYRLFLCLADRAGPEFDAAAEPFEVVQADALGIPGFDDMVLRYDIMEFNTAVKPSMIRWLFDRTDSETVIYLDPDIRVYSRLEAIEAQFERGASVVLTPHISKPLEDGKTPNDHHMLQAGVFNLGFIGLRRCAETLQFVDWWARRLATQAVSDIRNNLFTDQRWCDLAPCFLDHLAVLKDPGYNVAYWNLAERTVEPQRDQGWRVNGRPLAFFHFSGVNIARRNLVSKHQDRFTWDNAAPLRPLFDGYFEALVEQGIEATRQWKYAYAEAGGVALTPLLRQFYRQLHPQAPAGGALPDARAWLARANETEPGMPVDEPGRVTRLMHLIHTLRPDLQSVFALGTPAGRDQFCRWFAQAGQAEYGLPKNFVPVPGAARAAPAVAAAAPAAGGHAAASTVGVGEAHARLAKAWQGLPMATRRHLAPGWQAALGVLGEQGSALAGAGRAELTPLMRLVWSSRADLQSAFDLDSERGLRQFGRWFRANAANEYGPHMAQADASPLAQAFPGPTGGRGEPGANLVGYARAEIGMGEHVRMTAAALAPTGVPFGLINVAGAGSGRQSAELEAGTLMDAPRFRANVLHVNADQMLSLYGQRGPALFEGRYNIGYWAWELSRWPAAWLPVLDMVHEVWAPSAFIRDAIAAVARVPVRHMPLCVTVPAPDPRFGRAHFGLDADAFHFLYTFDLLSYVERKNPKAAVAAFRRAFPQGSEKVRLVLKTMNGQPASPAWRLLHDLAASDPRIVLLNHTMTRPEVLGLAASCDAFVSLHRAEGFGRGPAEAMFLGKPVIVTAYSGNMDFTTPETAALVEHRLVPVGAGEYPMHEGQVWADPDIDHAAWHMQRLVADPAAAAALGRAGQHFIHENFSQRRVGALYAQRLRELALVS